MFGGHFLVLSEDHLPLANAISFISLLLQKGSLRKRGVDFNNLRKESLKGLEKFLPDQQPGQKKVSKNVVLHNLRSTGAFIKDSILTGVGHLEAPGKKLAYIRVPKSASTSICHGILKSNFPDLPGNLNETQINFVTDAWLKTSLRDWQREYTAFTVIRNPLHRLVSVYRDFLEHPRSDFFIYEDYLFGILSARISFEEFVNRISRIPDRLRDQHIKPQHLFVNPYQKRGIPVKILRLEEPDSIRQFLDSCHLEFPHLNKGSGYNYADYYTQSLSYKVEKLYALDFRLYENDHN